MIGSELEWYWSSYRLTSEPLSTDRKAYACLLSGVFKFKMRWNDIL